MRKQVMSVRLQIMLGFVIVTLLAASPAAWSLFRLNDVSKQSTTIIEDTVPVMQAALALDQLVTELMLAQQRYLAADKNHEAVEAQIASLLQRFELTARAMRDGPRHPDVVRLATLSPDGQAAIASLPVAPPDQLKPFLNRALNSFAALRLINNDLTEAHRSKLAFMFVFDGQLYAIDRFCSRLLIEFREWVSDLDKSAQFGTPFQGNTDYAKSTLGRWKSQFTTDDDKLKGQLARVHTTASRIHRLADQIGRAPAEKRHEIFNSQGEIDFKRYERQLAALIDYTEKAFGGIEAQARDQFAQAVAGSEQIKVTTAELRQHVQAELHSVKANVKRTGDQAMLWGALFLGAGVVLAIVIGLIVGGGLARKLSALARVMSGLAGGRLDIAMPAPGPTKEIVAMVAALGTFRENAVERANLQREREEQANRSAAERRAEMERVARSFEETVGRMLGTVMSATQELETSARTLAGTATGTQKLSVAVATASEQASSNVNAVAAATSQLTCSISEISRQASESSRVAADAVEKADATNRQMHQLNNSARQIGSVVEIIRGIARQTNLLALNATIEAARAGETGKGFAVVAQEVKQLAAQTSRATDDIVQQVSAVQDATGTSVMAIEEIRSVIAGMSSFSASIAASVEEQTKSTEEIGSNIAEASRGTAEVYENAAQVTSAARNTETASARMLTTAESLAESSRSLRSEVAVFLDKVRAA